MAGSGRKGEKTLTNQVAMDNEIKKLNKLIDVQNDKELKHLLDLPWVNESGIKLTRGIRHGGVLHMPNCLHRAAFSQSKEGRVFSAEERGEACRMMGNYYLGGFFLVSTKDKDGLYRPISKTLNKDIGKAMAWLVKAADFGDVEARLMLQVRLPDIAPLLQMGQLAKDFGDIFEYRAYLNDIQHPEDKGEEKRHAYFKNKLYDYILFCTPAEQIKLLHEMLDAKTPLGQVFHPPVHTGMMARLFPPKVDPDDAIILARAKTQLDSLLAQGMSVEVAPRVEPLPTPKAIERAEGQAEGQAPEPERAEGQAPEQERKPPVAVPFLPFTEQQMQEVKAKADAAEAEIRAAEEARHRPSGGGRR